MSAELQDIPGYFPVSKDKAKQIIAPHLATDGFYLLRPTDGEAICTICVSNNQKLMNYRLFRDLTTGHYYIRDNKFPSISSLIQYYKKFPLNEQFKTFLLYPVPQDHTNSEYVALVPPTGHEEPTSSSRATQNGPGPQARGPNPRGGERGVPTQRGREKGGSEPKCDNLANLPGVHLNLSKNDVPVILSAFLDQDGSYLLRPSVSSKGQYTISLTCELSILNFKINTDPADGKFFITPKKKFSSIQELLDHHRTAPLRSKARTGAKIFLIRPITMADIQRLFSQINALPPPWQEFFDDNHKRPYYYNAQTGESVWERPKPSTSPPNPLPISKSQTMGPRTGNKSSLTNRPLPSIPQNEATVTSNPRFSLDSGISCTGRGPTARKGSDSMFQRPLPDLPQKNTSNSSRPLPQLPGKGELNLPNARGLPNLPSKDKPTPSPSIPKKGSPRPELRDFSAPPPLPSKQPSPTPDRQNFPLPTTSSPLPPLPSKQPSPKPDRHDIPFPLPTQPQQPNLPPLPSKIENNSIPPLPPKNDMSPLTSNNFPPLPPKDQNPIPPLPPKEDGPCMSVPSLPPKEPTTNGHSSQSPQILKKNRPVEYMDTVIQVAPPTPPLPTKAIPPPPAISTGGGPPPPPPIPPGGIPAPPPPPPALPSDGLPPSQSRRSNTVSLPQKETPPPAAGGRPFSANDLQLAKTLLKRKEEEEFSQPKSSGGGLHDVFSNALDQRLTTIRSAMTTSDDEDTDIEEVDDDDWDD